MPKFGIDIAIAVKCLSFGFDLTELWALENSCTQHENQGFVSSCKGCEGCSQEDLL